MSENPLKLKRVHHTEFWVGNAKQAAFYYNRAFGFSQVAYSGLETGNRDRASYVMNQHQVRFVLSTPLSSKSDPVSIRVEDCYVRSGKDVGLAVGAVEEAL